VLSVSQAGRAVLRDKRTARVEQRAQALADGFRSEELDQLRTAVPLIERLARSV
jgi:hypothetical protein